MPKSKKKEVKQGFFEESGKKYDDCKKRIQDLLDYWIPKLALSHHRIDVDYHSSLWEKDSGARALMSSQWEYEQIAISFYMPNMLGESLINTEYTIVHELCHAMVNPMSRGTEEQHYVEHEENTVTRLAKALIRVKYEK